MLKIDRETLEYWQASVRNGHAALLEVVEAFDALQSEVGALRDTVFDLMRIIEILADE